MKRLSNNENSLVANLALKIYLGVYRDLIENIKPYMGLVDIDLAITTEVLNVMLYGDMVIDISSVIKPNTPRASIRSYLSTASSSDRKEVLAKLEEIIYDPAMPTYFKGFRKNILTKLVIGVSAMKWGMGDIVYKPAIVINELDAPTVSNTLQITVRLRS